MHLRVIIGALVTILGYQQYQLWFTPQGYAGVEMIRQQIAHQAQQNNEIRQQNALLEREVAMLKNNLVGIEARARYDLGMIKPDETFYRVIE